MYELRKQQNILTMGSVLKQKKKACGDFNRKLDVIDENVSLTLQLALLERSKGLPMARVLQRLERLSEIAPKPHKGL